jgi:hypothetical protein
MSNNNRYNSRPYGTMILILTLGLVFVFFWWTQDKDGEIHNALLLYSNECATRGGIAIKRDRDKFCMNSTTGIQIILPEDKLIP